MCDNYVPEVGEQSVPKATPDLHLVGETPEESFEGLEHGAVPAAPEAAEEFTPEQREKLLDAYNEACAENAKEDPAPAVAEAVPPEPPSEPKEVPVMSPRDIQEAQKRHMRTTANIFASRAVNAMAGLTDPKLSAKRFDEDVQKIEHNMGLFIELAREARK